MALIDRLNGDDALAAHTLANGPARCEHRRAPRARCAIKARRRCPSPTLGVQPAWDLVDIEKYRRVWRRAHGYFSLNMAASRGCSFRCNWCAKPIWGNQYLQRPARDIAAEMIHLRRHYRPDHIWFADDIFGFQRRLGERVRRRAGGRRRRRAVHHPAARRSRQPAHGRGAARRRLPRSLDRRRERQPEDPRRHEQGHAASPKSSQARTLARRRRHPRRASSCSSAISAKSSTTSSPRAGWSTRRGPTTSASASPIHCPAPSSTRRCKQQLGAKTHWNESNDLEMMFAGTYHSDFYRAVRNLLHDQVTHAAIAGDVSDALGRAVRQRAALPAIARRAGPRDATGAACLQPRPLN